MGGKGITFEKGFPMRANIVIDDQLMRDVLRVTGFKTKREAMEEVYELCCA
jgi:Arc/MetJ family transcription regulator